MKTNYSIPWNTQMVCLKIITFWTIAFYYYCRKCSNHLQNIQLISDTLQHCVTKGKIYSRFQHFIAKLNKNIANISFTETISKQYIHKSNILLLGNPVRSIDEKGLPSRTICKVKKLFIYSKNFFSSTLI